MKASHIVSCGQTIGGFDPLASLSPLLTIVHLTSRIWLPLLIRDSFFVGRVDFGISPSGSESAIDTPMLRSWFATLEKW
jgi:hypothetical protein